MVSVARKLKSFFDGRYYPVFVALLVFLGHSTEWEVLFGSVMLLSLILGCWVCDDLRFAVSPFLFTIFIVPIAHSPNVPYYSKYYVEPLPLTVMIVLAVLLIISMVFFTVRNRKMINKKEFFKKPIWISLLILCGSLLLNGLFSKGYTVQNLLFACSFLLALLLLYFLFGAYIRSDKGIVDYLMYCFVLAGMQITAQLIFAYFTTVDFVGMNPVKETVLLGWGVWTAIGGMLTLLMPACFYFAADHKHGWIGYFLGFFEFFAIFLSQSRGALLTGAFVLLLCLIVLFFKGTYKKRNRIFTLAVMVCGILGGILLFDKILALLQNFLNYGFGDNGRFDLWKTGIENFLKNPVFGSGFYAFVNESWPKAVYPYFYHNTLIQFLATAGAVGFLAYAYHRFCTVRLVFRKPNRCKLFLGIGILGWLAFCFIDVLFFTTYPTMFYALMLVTMEKSEEAGTV